MTKLRSDKIITRSTLGRGQLSGLLPERSSRGGKGGGRGSLNRGRQAITPGPGRYGKTAAVLDRLYGKPKKKNEPKPTSEPSTSAGPSTRSKTSGLAARRRSKSLSRGGKSVARGKKRGGKRGRPKKSTVDTNRPTVAEVSEGSSDEGETLAVIKARRDSEKGASSREKSTSRPGSRRPSQEATQSGAIKAAKITERHRSKDGERSETGVGIRPLSRVQSRTSTVYEDEPSGAVSSSEHGSSRPGSRRSSLDASQSGVIKAAKITRRHASETAVKSRSPSRAQSRRPSVGTYVPTVGEDSEGSLHEDEPAAVVGFSGKGTSRSGSRRSSLDASQSGLTKAAKVTEVRRSKEAGERSETGEGNRPPSRAQSRRPSVGTYVPPVEEDSEGSLHEDEPAAAVGSSGKGSRPGSRRSSLDASQSGLTKAAEVTEVRRSKEGERSETGEGNRPPSRAQSRRPSVDTNLPMAVEEISEGLSHEDEPLPAAGSSKTGTRRPGSERSPQEANQSKVTKSSNVTERSKPRGRQATLPSNGKTAQNQGQYASKRHRSKVKNAKIAAPQLRRLARRGGVKRISAKTYDSVRNSIRAFAESVITGALNYMLHAKRKTVYPMDIIYSLKRLNRTLYGFGG